MMGKLAIPHLVMREFATVRRAGRAPEPQAVMSDPQEVAAYTAAGRELAIMAPTYLFHTAQACEVLCPGDRVLDLACGPGTQLAQLAGLNTDAEFVGADLSAEMLQYARQLVSERGLRNVTLVEGDITDLSAFADNSFGAIVSSMSLHHLPDVCMLTRTFSEAARLLRLGGGVYLADFGRLKSQESMRAFAYRDADRQPEAFTRDYFNSLRAAFSVGEVRAATREAGLPGRVFRMCPVPFMIAVKSRPRRPFSPELLLQLAGLRDSMPAQGRADLTNMIRCFRLGGMRTKLPQ